MSNQVSQAPSTVLTAAGSGREFRLDQLPRTAAVLLMGQSTASAVDGMVEAIRAKYPEEQVLIANVVDLGSFPKLLKKVAEMTLNGRYDGWKGRLREGLVPEEHIVILPDWDGTVAPALGLSDVDKQFAVAVVKPDGEVVGTYQGPEPQPKAVELLDRAFAS
jgi:hypothetical protein